MNSWTANFGQASFEAVAQIVNRVENIVDLKSDRHGHKSVLLTCIEYGCTLPHPELHLPCEIISCRCYFSYINETLGFMI